MDSAESVFPGRTEHLQQCGICGGWCPRTVNVCPTCNPPLPSTWSDAQREQAARLYGEELRRLGEERFWQEMPAITKRVHARVDDVRGLDEPDESAYPYEITLPLWRGEELGTGVPVLPGTGIAERERLAHFRTYWVRFEDWGHHPEQSRTVAVFQRQSGELAPVKNPYTLALLREALGLVERA